MATQADVSRQRAKIEKLQTTSDRTLAAASASRIKAGKARQAAARAKSPSTRDRKLREALRLDEEANKMDAQRATTEKQITAELKKLHAAEVKVARAEPPRQPRLTWLGPPSTSTPTRSAQPQFPSVNDLYQGRTVFVLGAGASKDYGFPDWSDLRDQLVDLISAESNPNSRSVFRHIDASESDLANLVQTIENLPENRTIDWLVEEEQARDRLFVGTVFRQGVGHILSTAEAADAKNGVQGWISELFEKLSQVSDSAPLKLNVITLNYERCFEHAAAEAIRRYGIGEHVRPELCTKPNVRVVHPHGRLGSFPGGLGISNNIVTASSERLPGNTPLAYGETAPRGYEYPIFPIDTLRKLESDSLQQGYQQANDDLKTAKSAILLGISPNGLANSELVFPTHLGVWIAGSELEFSHNSRAHAKLPQHVEYVDGYGRGIIQRLVTSREAEG